MHAVAASLSLTQCGSAWYQRLPLQYFELDQALLAGYSFDSACQAHDACYGDCKTRKEDCDMQLLQNAEGVCADALLKSNCLNAAKVFHFAVSKFGDTAFKEARCKCFGQAGADNAGVDFLAARPVSAGEVVVTSLRAQGKHYYRLTPKQTDTYVVYSRGATRIHGEVFNNAQFSIASDTSSGDDGNFRIAARLLAGQPYYIEVQGQPGPYELHIEGPEGKTVSDDHGSSHWSATPVTAGSITPGFIDIVNDRDYFLFKPGMTATYVLFSRGGNRVFGELYTEKLGLLESDALRGEQGNFRIALRLNAGQTYFLVLGGQPGQYALHIEGPEGGTVTDDHGFSSWSATKVGVGSPIKGLIDLPNDQDFFKFTPSKSVSHVIYTTGGTHIDGELYDGNFNRLSSNTPPSANRRFQIVNELESGQAYYLMIRGEPGLYTLHIEVQ